jgi:DNA invertase Pin-like site-specific DNA recombinase
MRVAIYCRVSTAQQTTVNQRLDLERVAALRGWTIVETYQDNGISGAKCRNDRPALDKMLKDAVRVRFDLIAVWSIDRLGRSLKNLVDTVAEVKAVGIDFYFHQQCLDTSTPAGKLAFNVFASLAEYEKSLIRERVCAGLQRARLSGTKLGRPTNLNDTVRAAIVEMRGRDVPIRKIAQQLRVGTGSVYGVLASAAALQPA